MPYYTLANKKGETLTVSAPTSDDAKRKALAAGLEPDVSPSWTGREKRDYRVLKISKTKPKLSNPGAKQFTVTLSSGKSFKIIAANQTAALREASRMFPGAKVNPGLKNWTACKAVRIANGKVQIRK